MRGLAIGALATAMTFALPAAAAAAEEPDVAKAPTAPPPAGPHASGLRLGMRYGVAVPIGQTFADSGALHDSVSASVPFRLDVGYRLLRHFYFGVNAQLAPLVPNGCPEGGSCSGSDLRFGAMAAYHFLPDRFVDPWIGAGVGYERMSLSRSVGGASIDLAARGLELLDVELGADCRVTRALRIGPVLSSSLGRFSTIAVNGTATHDFNTSLHAWVMLGIRGAYDL